MSDDELKCLQETEKEILRAFVRLCDENGLVYWLIGGSLLGAVRHHGFIPWDDDVDVLMPREDYEKLIRLQMPEGLFLQNLHTEKECLLLFAKLMKKDSELREQAREHLDIRHGVFIDIFPLDFYPEGIVQDIVRWCIHLAVHYRMRHEFAVKETSFLKGLAARLVMKTTVLLFPDVYSLMVFYDRYLQKTKQSGRVFVSGGAYGRKDIYEAAWFESSLMVKFEDLTVRIPAGFHHILERVYGDYMSLPDEKDRHGHHGIVKLVLNQENNGQGDGNRITINKDSADEEGEVVCHHSLTRH